jgi:flagellar biosynthesis protein FlhB
VAKLLVFSMILFLWLRDTQTHFETTVLFEEPAALIKIRDLALTWLWFLLATYVAFACFDLLWQTREHAQKNRMSHKEMKDEHKNEEGDETIRQQRRAKAEEIATNRMLLDVPKAAVIIVNPTHYAVALKWTGGKKEVPKCVAKGVDETARKIRDIAVQSGVPLYQDPATARHLHATVKIGATINHDHYKAVAVAMSYAQRIQKMARS